MKAEEKTEDRMRAILVIVATIGTILFNGLAATGYVNGITPADISAKYPTVLTPSGYAFSIWSLIYLGLLIFSVYQIRSPDLAHFRSVRSLYILSCVLNCAWIFFWHREQVVICLGLILALLISLALITMRLRGVSSVGNTWLVRAPFGIYFGWVTVASTVNFLVMLVYLGIRTSPLTDDLLAILLMTIATAAAVLVRIKLRDFFYPLAIAWALTAIAVNQGGHTAIVVAAAFGVVICFVTTGSVVVELKDSTSE